MHTGFLYIKICTHPAIDKEMEKQKIYICISFQSDICFLLSAMSIVTYNLKKLSRENLKNVQGGLKDFCQPGAGDVCAQYGLECGFWYTVQNGQVIEYHNACI